SSPALLVKPAPAVMKGKAITSPCALSDRNSSVLPLELFPGAGLRLEDFVLTPRTAVALLVATAPTAACPRCGTSSDLLHARYRRTVADLPCQGRAVALRLLVRKFRCTQADCPQAIFGERLPDLLRPYARATDRLTAAHQDLGFALGGEAG